MFLVLSFAVGVLLGALLVFLILRRRGDSADGAIRPLTESLSRFDAAMRSMEAARERAFGGIEQQLLHVSQGTAQLQRETGALVTALRTPHVRGRWGEMTLRRVAELAGMVDRCDFYEQGTFSAEDGARIRPDMLVRLPGGRSVVVDSKVALTAYLDALSAGDEVGRRAHMVRHSRQISKHVEQLSDKSYWAQFQPAPEFVILFLPGDQFLSAALEFNDRLLEEAIERRILLATPSTLIAILKGVGFGWRQELVAENTEEFRRLARELFERASGFVEHLRATGRTLEKTVEAYNRAVGSIDTRLMPTLRKFKEMGATAAVEPAALTPVDRVPRDPDAST